MLLVLCSLFSLFNYQEISGSAFSITSIGNSAYLATAINPAMLSELDKNSVGIVYACPYNIKEIQYNRLAGNYKNFGMNVSRLGQIGYEEYVISLSTGFNLTQELSYGLMLKGLYLDLSEYGQTLIPALNFGIVYQFPKMQFGAVLENMNHPLNSETDNIPWSIIVGARFQPVSDLSLGLELEKSNHDQNLTLGAEFKPISNLFLRVSTKTNPFIISAGFGFIYKNFLLDYAIKFHTRLKDTSVFSLGYTW